MRKLDKSETGDQTSGTVPNRVREFRVAKGRGWTQKRLARAARVTEGTISRVERGDRNPSPLVAYKIAKSLGYAVEEVFPGMSLAMEAV